MLVFFRLKDFGKKQHVKVREIDFRKLESIVKNEDQETQIMEPRKRKPGNEEALEKGRAELDVLIKMRLGHH